MLLFGLNTSVGLFLELSAFSAKIAIVSFYIEISLGSVVERLIFFPLLRTILVGVSGGNFLATFASVFITIPFDMQRAVALEASDWGTRGNLWIGGSERSDGRGGRSGKGGFSNCQGWSFGHWRGSFGVYFYWSEKSSLKCCLFKTGGEFF